MIETRTRWIVAPLGLKAAQLKGWYDYANEAEAAEVAKTAGPAYGLYEVTVTNPRGA